MWLELDFPQVLCDGNFDDLTVSTLSDPNDVLGRTVVVGGGIFCEGLLLVSLSKAQHTLGSLPS
jgi:hypothetical protein